MQNLVLVQVDELRQIIREELFSNLPEQQVQKAFSKPKTQKELCEFLSLSEPTIISWRNKGKIPYMQIGSAIRYDSDAVIKALEVNQKRRK